MDHKGNDDMAHMFEGAKRFVGKVSETLVSDGAPNFGHARRKQYRTKNSLHKESTHECHIHMAGDINNNQMESFNGATLRHREKVVRGLKKNDSVILIDLRLYHNHVHPHLSLPDSMTSGEVASIPIEGDNKWLTLIQAAAKSAA